MLFRSLAHNLLSLILTASLTLQIIQAKSYSLCLKEANLVSHSWLVTTLISPSRRVLEVGPLNCTAPHPATYTPWFSNYIAGMKILTFNFAYQTFSPSRLLAIEGRQMGLIPFLNVTSFSSSMIAMSLSYDLLL